MFLTSLRCGNAQMVENWIHGHHCEGFWQSVSACVWEDRADKNVVWTWPEQLRRVCVGDWTIISDSCASLLNCGENCSVLSHKCTDKCKSVPPAASAASCCLCFLDWLETTTPCFWKFRTSLYTGIAETLIAVIEVHLVWRMKWVFVLQI